MCVLSCPLGGCRLCALLCFALASMGVNYVNHVNQSISDVELTGGRCRFALCCRLLRYSSLGQVEGGSCFMDAYIERTLMPLGYCLRFFEVKHASYDEQARHEQHMQHPHPFALSRTTMQASLLALALGISSSIKRPLNTQTPRDADAIIQTQGSNVHWRQTQY